MHNFKNLVRQSFPRLHRSRMANAGLITALTPDYGNGFIETSVVWVDLLLAGSRLRVL